MLAALAHQSAYLGHAAQTVEYATAAADLGRRSGQRHLIAEAAVLQAQGHAGLGSRSAAASALNDAERYLDRADRDNRPAYLAYLDEAYLSAKFGWVLRELGDGPGTVRFAERSLDMRPGYERGRVFNLALLAHGHAQCGQLDQCVEATNEALRLSRDMKSSRAVRYLRDVASLLKPHTKRPDVAAVRKRIRYLKPVG